MITKAFRRTDNNFHHNTFYSSVGTSGGTASIYITEGPTANVYNNLFIHQGKTRAISFANGPLNGGSDQLVRVFNNTFICDFTMQTDWGATSTRIVGGHGEAGDSTVVYKNNIFRDFSTSSAAHMIYSVQPRPGAVDALGLQYLCNRESDQ